MNEPSGLSRRRLLAGAGALLAGAGLAGCENTTTPVATAEGSSGNGIMGDPTAGGPVDASGIPLARRDYPVTLPKIGDPVKAGKPESGGELQVYNYADYLNPEVIKAFGKQEGVSVRVTTFNSLDEAFTKLSTGRLEVRRHLHGARPPVAAGRPAPGPAAEPRPRPEPRDRGLAGAAEPVLRRRPALHGPVHALHDRDRLAQRQARRLRSGRARLGVVLEVRARSAGASACSTTRARASGWR